MLEEFSQVPPSPQSVPGVPDTVGQPELSQEEMTGNLQQLMDKINSKYQEFNADKFSSDNLIAQSKSQSLRDVFDMLQSVGIDPSNVEQVKEFLDKIKNTNPELYQQVSKAFQDIIAGDDVNEGPELDTGEISQDPGSSINMNINTNEAPQENI